MFRTICRLLLAAMIGVTLSSPLTLHAAPAKTSADPDTKPGSTAAAPELPRTLSDESQSTQGSVNVAGRALPYTAVAGLLVVHVKDPMDDDSPPRDDKTPPTPHPPEASMSYVAYFKNGAGKNGTGKGELGDPRRPITFLFNGGPGSSTVWLHMGAFGPKRVITADDSHTPASPYRLVDNDYTLLGVSDLVFIDAPGTGFSHLRGADKEKAFYGVDQDAHAFANFIVEFLSRYNRWNSPKYLFGESYGSTRAAALANILEDEKSIDLNGILLIGQIFNFDNNADGPQVNPGVEFPYALVLPSYAASAWYHKRLPVQAPALEPLLREVEGFALNEYLPALVAGPTLSAERRSAIVAKLHEYTGLSPDYIERSNLRINVGQFAQNLSGGDATVGRLDSRFSGPSLDVLSKEADYDPQAASISSAYVATFNDYVRSTLKFGIDKTYKASTDVYKSWDLQHQPPGAPTKLPGLVNVMPDLAAVMKRNPLLKVQLNNGYYDLATPYFSAIYELRQLQIPASLQANIETHFYTSGHMIYAHEPDLKALHANAAAFIEKNQGGRP